MQYNQPTGAAANAPYVDGNPGTGTPGSVVPAAAIEYTQREIVQVITAAGLTASNADNTQLYQAISALIAGGSTNTSYGTTAGGTTVFTVTTTPTYSSFKVGQLINVKMNATNTGAATLNVNSIGAKSIVDVRGNAIDANSLVINRIYELAWDGTNLVLKSQKQQLLSFAADTGTANTYAVAPNPVLDALVAGMIVELIPTHANTSSSTLSVNALGAVTILTQAGANLTANMLLTTGVYLLEYTGTNWILLNPSASTSIVSVKHQVFSSSTTYTPSTGMVEALVTVQAPGGAGASIGASAGGAGSGGGQGAKSVKLVSAATVGSSQTITIGSTTSFGAIMSCTQGSAGTFAASTAINRTAGGAGGTATGGDQNFSGANGGDAYADGSSGFANTAGMGGGGVGAPLATYGTGSGNIAIAGYPGTRDGQGGSGAASGTTVGAAVSGGAGAPGWIEVIEYCTQ